MPKIRVKVFAWIVGRTFQVLNISMRYVFVYSSICVSAKDEDEEGEAYNGVREQKYSVSLTFIHVGTWILPEHDVGSWPTPLSLSPSLVCILYEAHGQCTFLFILVLLSNYLFWFDVFPFQNSVMPRSLLYLHESSFLCLRNVIYTIVGVLGYVTMV